MCEKYIDNIHIINKIEFYWGSYRPTFLKFVSEVEFVSSFDP